MAVQIIQFLLSLLAISALVWVSARLGLGGSPRISSEAEARELADDAVCGFVAERVAIDGNGRGALLADKDGRILLLVPHGVHFAARLLDPGNMVSFDETGELTITATDRHIAPARLSLGEQARAWGQAVEGLG